MGIQTATDLDTNTAAIAIKDGITDQLHGSLHFNERERCISNAEIVPSGPRSSHQDQGSEAHGVQARSS